MLKLGHNLVICLYDREDIWTHVNLKQPQISHHEHGSPNHVAYVNICIAREEQRVYSFEDDMELDSTCRRRRGWAEDYRKAQPGVLKDLGAG